jgi:hypothetical protein
MDWAGLERDIPAGLQKHRHLQLTERKDRQSLVWRC